MVPLEEFTEESLRITLSTVAVTLGTRWGLTSPTQTPNFDPWLAIMRERYGYATDDVPHRDLLGDDVLDENGRLMPLLL